VFELTGPGAAAEAEALKAAPGVQSVAAFGASLHVAGQDAARCSAPWPRWPSAPACGGARAGQSGRRVHRPDRAGAGHGGARDEAPERFSLARTAAVFIKEFQQMLRDRPTFAMAVGVPIIQLVLFGYAINTDPKGLPTAVVAHDSGPLARSLVAALQNTGYFRMVASGIGQAQADALLARGDVQFVVVVPPRFERVAARRAPVLTAWTPPTPAPRQRAGRAERRGRAGAGARPGRAAAPAGRAAALRVRIQRRYNPEGLSRYNIVPGLIGTILTMTMVMLTALAMTRERERGTMENLLATPVRPLEVMVGKIAPYVVVGYVQLGVILLAAWALFQVPMVGSFALLMAMIGVFILANLAVGFTFSTLARQPAAGGADDLLFLPALDAAVGLHVPVSRHAALGAVGGRGAAADALPAHRARHPAQGQRLARRAARAVAHAGLHARRGRGGAAALPQNAGLSPR
jgi:ABC-2 type transport system permease protein